MNLRHRVTAIVLAALALLPLLRAAAAGGQAPGAPPVLHLDLPQSIGTVQKLSPGVELTQVYSGNVGGAVWEVGSPVALAGDAAGCPFMIPVPKLPHGAVVLSGAVKDAMIGSLHVDSFGASTEPQAFAAIERLAAKLTGSGWGREPDAVQATAAHAHRMLLHETDSLVVRSLVCGHTRMMLSLARDLRRPRTFYYALDYDIPPR